MNSLYVISHRAHLSAKHNRTRKPRPPRLVGFLLSRKFPFFWFYFVFHFLGLALFQVDFIVPFSLNRPRENIKFRNPRVQIVRGFGTAFIQTCTLFRKLGAARLSLQVGAKV